MCRPKATVHAVIGNAGDSEGLTDKWESCPDWSVIRQASLGYAKLFFESRTKLKFDLVEIDEWLLAGYLHDRAIRARGASAALSVYT